MIANYVMKKFGLERGAAQKQVEQVIKDRSPAAYADTEVAARVVPRVRTGQSTRNIRGPVSPHAQTQTGPRPGVTDVLRAGRGRGTMPAVNQTGQQATRSVGSRARVKFTPSQIKEAERLLAGKKSLSKKKGGPSLTTNDGTLRGVGVFTSQIRNSGIIPRGELKNIERMAQKFMNSRRMKGRNLSNNEWMAAYSRKENELLTEAIKRNPRRVKALLTFMKKSWGEACDLLKSIYNPSLIIKSSWEEAFSLLKSV